MDAPLHVVDLFAGPGGLAEGFAAVTDSRGRRPYRVALSVEKDSVACRTLRLRAFCRQFSGGPPNRYYAFLNGELDAEPDWSKEFPEEWMRANSEALLLELGTEEAKSKLPPRLRHVREQSAGRTVVIGGPPCQAYSVVGRARNQAKSDYVARDDRRHYLYREYVDTLRRLHPVAFVMENVRGLMSSLVDGQPMYSLVLEDLRNAAGPDSYRLHALGFDEEGRPRLQAAKDPSDFLVSAEDFGVPQARHRVIVVGVRSDLADTSPLSDWVVSSVAPQQATLRHVLGTMPRLRSGLSSGADSFRAWRREMMGVGMRLREALKGADGELARVSQSLDARSWNLWSRQDGLERSSAIHAGVSERCPDDLRDWLVDARMKGLTNHETRSHMTADLDRYCFAALFAEALGRSPKSADFPPSLRPEHKSWDRNIFSDRFRVQCWDRPSTTVTSHIAKDGHYFIHPDSDQCRSLTVREAARLQTFPDNYLFLGNRTQQYVQVGNAVPPYLARQVAEALCRLLGAMAEEAAGSFDGRAGFAVAAGPELVAA